MNGGADGLARLTANVRARFGDGAVLDQSADVAAYAGDLSGVPSASPLCVLRPRSTDEVAAIIRLCSAERLAIVPRGGGTGLSGGVAISSSLPSVVLSLERMRAIRALDLVGNLIVVEAGCTLGEVHAQAATAGLCLGLDHGGAGSSQIGGNLATNAGGNNVVRYGMAREQVLGLEAVLADGTILSDLTLLPKNTAGYDLKQLFIGSEGTLGIITAAALRLRPAPIAVETALFALDTVEQALDFFQLSRGDIGEMLSAFELMPAAGLALHRSHSGDQTGFADPPPWAALIEIESTSRHFAAGAAMEGLYVRASEAGLVQDGLIASSSEQRTGLWRMREGIAIAMIEQRGSLKSDTAVPVRAIPDFLKLAGAAVAGVVPGCRPVPFGHIGDGNIHFNVLPPLAMSGDSFIQHHEALTQAIEGAALHFGGTVSAEHGVGLRKKNGLLAMRSPAHIATMRALKRTLDPHGLLNPGKVIDVT